MKTSLIFLLSSLLIANAQPGGTRGPGRVPGVVVVQPLPQASSFTLIPGTGIVITTNVDGSVYTISNSGITDIGGGTQFRLSMWTNNPGTKLGDSIVRQVGTNVIEQLNITSVRTAQTNRIYSRYTDGGANFSRLNMIVDTNGNAYLMTESGGTNGSG